MKLETYGKIHFVPGVGNNSNSIVVIDEKIAVIDPGLPDNYYLLGVLEELGVTPDQVDIVVNTDCHADHCGGNSMFHNAKIYSGKESSDYISSADPKYTLSETFGVKLKKRKVQALKDGQILDLGETKLKVINTPGHAPDGISLYSEELKVLICGDVIFREGIGRTDFPGGDIKKLRKTIEKISEMDIDIFIPGHGPSGMNEHILLALDLVNMLAPGVAGK